MQPFTVSTAAYTHTHACTHTHTHITFNGPLSRTTQVSQYQKSKTNLDFTEARDSEWQLYQLGHMQVCTSLQTDNHASTPPLSFLQAGCPSCRPTNSVKALKVFSTATTCYNSSQYMTPLVHKLLCKNMQWHCLLTCNVRSNDFFLA